MKGHNLLPLGQLSLSKLPQPRSVTAHPQTHRPPATSELRAGPRRDVSGPKEKSVPGEGFEPSRLSRASRVPACRVCHFRHPGSSWWNGWSPLPDAQTPITPRHVGVKALAATRCWGTCRVCGRCGSASVLRPSNIPPREVACHHRLSGPVDRPSCYRSRWRPSKPKCGTSRKYMQSLPVAPNGLTIRPPPQRPGPVRSREGSGG